MATAIPRDAAGRRSNRGRVHRSARYVSWLRTAGWELQLQRPERFEGWVRISIAAGAPDRRRRDVDGLAKATLDLLVEHRIIRDDALVVSLTSKWSGAVAPGRLQVEVKRTRAPKRVRSFPA